MHLVPSKELNTKGRCALVAGVAAVSVICACTSALGAAKSAPKPAAKPAAKPAVKASTAKLAPYTESVAGSLIKFDMVPIPAGQITVNKKTVKVPAMWVGKTEVTWDQYDVFVFRLDDPNGGTPATGKDAESRPSKPYGAADRGYGHKGYPAIDLSFRGANAYCEWLSQKTGKKYRLPTEAEWEYACRAGQPEPTKDKLADYAWFWQEKTMPVGQKKPNAWGLYDMLGNVGEWAVGLDGKPAVCGGAYDDMAKGCTASARRYQDDSWQANDPQNPKSRWWLSDGTFVGFRVVCEK